MIEVFFFGVVYSFSLVSRDRIISDSYIEPCSFYVSHLIIIFCWAGQLLLGAASYYP